MSDEAAPVHPLAAHCMDAIVVPADGAKASIPKAKLTKLRQTLLAKRDERVVFEHLVVLWTRMRDAGLAIAAEQLLELAKIGLIDSEIEQMAASDRLRVAATSLAKIVDDKKVNGVITAKSNGFGVRLRKRSW